jgi:hypothetical protein
MNMKHPLFTLFALSCVGTISLVPNASAASLIYDPSPPDNCTTLNCRAVVLNGISVKNAHSDSVPFTGELFADANECLRLDITTTPVPRIRLISPSGAVWTNDDPDGLRHEITARTDFKGYYTVQINNWPGSQPVNSVQLFTLAYGRYVLGNAVNCFRPSLPALR